MGSLCWSLGCLWRWLTEWPTGGISLEHHSLSSSFPEATCITEMSVLMACWKENAFSDSACSTAIKVFYDCVAREQKARKLGAQDEKPAGWMPPQQVNKLLRKYPNIKHEI
ncbi:small ribosomal subunit protein mS37 isoform X2 [Dendrobates tinctorius]|uniref:small ribosomal subunit protein mS37 isoform X2 n=1 Tax=Dendrobates tinctorius TaxID=92724 RepID=UPI003CCA607B